MAMPKRTERGDTAASLPDVLQFMQVLWAVVHGLEKTSKRMAGELGVTGPQRLPSASSACCRVYRPVNSMV